jgi:hypothetical protein
MQVKLIVLDRLSELKKHHSKVVQEMLMDILRALSSTVSWSAFFSRETIRLAKTILI